MPSATRLLTRLTVKLGLAAKLLVVCLIAVAPAAYGQDWDFVLNGRSIHLDSDYDWNETNLGFGLEREFDQHSRWVKVALGNAFVDSSDSMSYMAGGGIKRRFLLTDVAQDLYVDLGAVGFLMSRQDTRGGDLFPGVLPALTVGMDRFAVNLTYMPRTWADKATGVTRRDPSIDGIVFVQLKLDASLLGFGRHNARGGGLFAGR